MKVNPENQMRICRYENIKGEKKMATNNVCVSRTNIREKHNWQSGIDKQDSLIDNNKS